MKMVAAAKLRRAQEAIENARPYATRMRSTLEEVSKGSLDEGHPLLEVHEERKSLELVVITSDRGLAGAFNSAVLKEAEAPSSSERAGEFETSGSRCWARRRASTSRAGDAKQINAQRADRRRRRVSAGGGRRA